MLYFYFECWEMSKYENVTLEGLLSAVSTRIDADFLEVNLGNSDKVKKLFCSIVWDLQDLRIFAPLQSQIVRNFLKMLVILFSI